MTLNKILIIGIFFFSPGLVFGQMGFDNKLSYTTQITFEEQSYLEKSFHNFRYYDVEKSDAISVSYNLMVHKEKNVTKRLNLRYGLGLKLINQEYDLTEITSSNWEYFEMGSSSVKCLYLSASTRLFYNKQNSKKFYLSPFIGFGLSVPISKSEKLVPIKSGFSDIIDPEFKFKNLVPEVSLGFFCIYNLNNPNFGIAIGPSLNNNSKYFHESVGVLSFPLSFSINLSLIRKKLNSQQP